LKAKLIILGIVSLLLSVNSEVLAQIDVSSDYCEYISLESFKIISTDKGDVAEVTLKNQGPDELIDSQLFLELDIPGPVIGSPTIVDIDQWDGLGGVIIATFSVDLSGIGVPDDMDVQGVESANDNDIYIETGIGVPDDMDVTGVIKVTNEEFGFECFYDISYSSESIISPCERLASEDSEVILGQSEQIEIPFLNATDWGSNYSELILDRNAYILTESESHRISRVSGDDSYNSFLITSDFEIIDGAIYNDESVGYTFTIYGDETKLFGCECEGSLVLRRNETGGIINTDELLVGAKVYPNPVKDRLNIRLENFLNSNVSLLITDFAGRTIESSTVTDNFTTIDVSSYPIGVYMVNIISDNRIKTEKIIVR